MIPRLAVRNIRLLLYDKSAFFFSEYLSNSFQEAREASGLFELGSCSASCRTRRPCAMYPNLNAKLP